ncbi:hypothetical protein ACR77J_07940 [Tissierella praeacuta]|uniref:hypothetical protein n=1 Tax=Tissierella praeacuta TaxID=43131 RepID=UPI003DA461AA
MIVTERDKKVINFIEENKIATTDAIAEIFYPCLRVAQHRLKLMYDNKLIKRDRDYYTSQYYYYLKKPKQIKHSLLVTEFYKNLNKIADIKMFRSEFIIENIRSDAFVAYEVNNIKKIAFVEVQISNTKLDIEKYEKLFKSGKYKSYFPVFPSILAITDRKVPQTNLDLIKINTNFNNLGGNLI